MRLLHLSDLHIGKRVNEFSLLEDQRFALEGVLACVRERDVDTLLVAGDLYDKATPSAEAVALVDWFLGAAAETGARVIAVAGNHDSAERVAYARNLLARQGVHLAPVYNGRIESVELADEHGPVRFWLVPFLKPASVRPFFPSADIATYTDALRCALEACDLDPTVRNVALAHQYVTFGGTEPERSDSELSLGGMDNVDAGVFDAFDYVALGHVHRPQRVKRDEVRYSGSLLKYSFSEIRDTKTAPLVELGPKGRVSIELVPVEPLHDMRRLRGPLDELVAPEVVAAGNADDYLQVVLTDEHPGLDVLERLREVYPNVMGVEYDNARTRARAAGERAGSAATTQKSPLELFEEFYLAQNGAQLSCDQRALVVEALEKAQVL